MADAQRHVGITGFFLFLSALYLIPETAFNAKLVEVAGAGHAGDGQLHLTELFGRTISGIGVTLMIADSLIKGALAETWKRAAASFLVVFLLTWPTVFFGQKWLVDQLLVEPSSAQQRQEAFFTTILRSGLAANAVNIKGLPYDASRSNSSEEMTFLAMMGGLVYVNTEFLAHVEDQKVQILERYITNRAKADFYENYSRYKELRKEVHKGWDRYQEGMREFDAALASSPKRADEAWSEVEFQISSGWEDYQKLTKAYRARAEARAQEFRPKFEDIMKHKLSCSKIRSDSRKWTCYERTNENYKKLLKKLDIDKVPVRFWLLETVDRVKGSTDGWEFVNSLGISGIRALVEQAMGDGGEEVKSLKFANHVQHYSNLMLAMSADEFEAESHYPIGLSDFETFRTHPETAKRVRARAAKEGVKLPAGWLADDIGVFFNAVDVKVRQEANKHWQSAMARHGYSMSPQLSWQQFQRHRDIQGEIEAEMGNNYISPVLASWNNRQFYNSVVEPNIKREREYWLDYIEASRSQFEDGAQYAQHGKAALRSIIVPPISMSLSLLLVIMTAIKVPINTIKLTVIDGAVGRSWSLQTKAWLGRALGILPLVFVLSIPTWTDESKFISKGSTVGFFLDNIDDVFSAGTSFAVKWVIQVQPILHPIGQGLDVHLDISRGFSLTLEEPLAALDEAWAGHKDVKSTDSELSGLQPQKPHKAPFTILPEPVAATVKVMNIKPKYQSGMKLEPGSYRVRVESPGYLTKEIWLEHGVKPTKYTLSLQPTKTPL